MPYFEVDYEYKIPEWGTVELEADSAEQADQSGREYVYDIIPDAVDITINNIKEIKEINTKNG
jgi:hypothetical protein